MLYADDEADPGKLTRKRKEMLSERSTWPLVRKRTITGHDDLGGGRVQASQHRPRCRDGAPALTLRGERGRNARGSWQLALSLYVAGGEGRSDQRVRRKGHRERNVGFLGAGV